MSFKFSYHKDGSTQVIYGEGVALNQFVVRLQHEKGSENVEELWLTPIDYSGSVISTKRKSNKWHFDGKNIATVTLW